MDLVINQLLQWGNEAALIERVLWIERAGQRLVTIDVTGKTAWPTIIEGPTLERNIESGDIHLLHDMYENLRQPDDAFTLSEIRQRDKAWEAIEDIVAHQEEVAGDSVEGTIYHPSILGPLVEAAMENTGYSKQRIHACLRRYWQAGQMKNALLPHFDRYGTQSEEHKVREHHAPKRGRPGVMAKRTGPSFGVDIDETVKEYFRRGTLLYCEKTEKMTMFGAYEHILRLFFHEGKELRNGVPVAVVLPADKLPTFNQYRYWYGKEHGPARSTSTSNGLESGEGGRRTDLEQPGKRISGPGHQFEIHVVTGGICLVSMLNRRRILGRPVIYIIVDVFSELIVGMCVSLEGPSWQGAMLALENTALDKVAYCGEYGIHIAEHDWPSHHLPNAILVGDGLTPELGNGWLNALGIQISKTQLCSSDWKESFARCFPLLDDTTIHRAPGSVNHHSEAERKGHRLDGCLTLSEFRRLVIDCIIAHNTAHRLSDDFFERNMIADRVEPYPRDVWQWGIPHRSGALRTASVDAIQRNLLPRAKALVTPKGIYYHHLLYECDRAVLEQWLEAPTGEKSRSRIPIVFDPRTSDHIYACPQDNETLKICRLLKEDQAEFEGCDWFDIEELIAHFRRETSIRTRLRQLRVEHAAKRDHIIEKAQQRMSEVSENRASEKMQEPETNGRGDRERKASETEVLRPIYKGSIERFFALITQELLRNDNLPPSSTHADADAPGPEAQPYPPSTCTSDEHEPAAEGDQV